MSNWLKILLKAAVTLALLGFVLYRMDLGRFWEVLSGAEWTLVFLAGVLHFLSVFPSVLRWRSILVHFQIRTPFAKLTQICLIGYFFNLLMPSAIGGDFFRAYYLSKRESKSFSTGLTSTILDRISGFAGMLMIALVACAFNPIRIEGYSVEGVLVVFGVLFMAGLVMVFHPWVHRRIEAVLQKFGFSGLEERFEMVYRGLEQLRRNPLTMATTVSLSLVIQVLVIVAMWLAARSIGIAAPFRLFFIFIPLVNLSMAFPFTINGVGLRETVYYLLFSQVGVPVEAAVTLSLLNVAITLMTAIPGGFAYSLFKKDAGFPVDVPLRSVPGPR